jgi:hypothetical protein
VKSKRRVLIKAYILVSWRLRSGGYQFEASKNSLEMSSSKKKNNHNKMDCRYGLKWW